jgi:hypothetical protein
MSELSSPPITLAVLAQKEKTTLVAVVIYNLVDEESHNHTDCTCCLGSCH